MTYNEILSAAQSLSETERQSLLQALSVGNQCEATVPESSRLSALLEKQGCCPHCGSNRYYRFGKDHGTQRFKCKDCGRTFTELLLSGKKGNGIIIHPEALLNPNRSLEIFTNKL